MKKTVLILLSFIGLFSSVLVSAQGSFTVASDTVYLPTSLINGGSCSLPDPITNTAATGGLTLRWYVKGTNFPVSWLTAGAFGVCDNIQCYPNAGDTALWNVGTSLPGSTHTSAVYAYETPGAFSLALNNLPNTPANGCYYVTVNLNDPAALYNKDVTFIICNTVTAVPKVSKLDDIVLYPNPATNEVNIVYDAGADVKNVAIYNIIGKMMSIYKVNGNSANLNLDNVPSGIYFVRVINSHGDVVATKKFTKQ